MENDSSTISQNSGSGAAQDSSPKSEKQLPSAKKDTSKLSFRNIFDPAWDLYTKNFLLFTGLMLVPAILATGLNRAWVTFAGKSDSGFMLVILVIIAIFSGVLNYIGAWSVLRAAAVVANKEITNIGEIITFTLKRFGTAIWLSIRIFWYTGAWIMLLLLGLGALCIFGVTYLPPEINQILPIATMIIPLVMIGLFIFLIKRMLQVSFSYVLLFSEENITAKQALQKSIALCKDITGTIFANYFIFGFFAGIVAGIFSGVATSIAARMVGVPLTDSIEAIKTYQASLSAIVEWLVIIPGAIIGAFAGVFTYVFKKQAEENQQAQ